MDNPADELPLFRTLDSAQTGIGFVNQLRDTKQLNILDYLYFYNGGGVAAGDINNDGLTDLYFISNQGKNKLYLNRGNLKFEDITDKAGVTGQADWQTGVTMVDINGDGRLDIYVCAVSKFRGLKGHNELYINNGDLTFTEKAIEYGLAFTGFSTQAAFFDYDHDGDLDCYLLNHAVHTSRSYDKVSTRTVRDSAAGDYLFQNNLIKTNRPLNAGAVKFMDVSAQAGIYGAVMGYGLGVSVADLNNDGWEDIYVSNDFHEDDYYYVNDHKGHFVETVRQAFQHTSRFSMGNDVADINNDGFADVITLDMYPADETIEKSSAGEDPLDIYQYKLQYGYMNQYSRNCLQLNVSGQNFMDIGLTAGVAATDWSWSPLLADYDNDGLKDLFIANGIVQRPNNLDYVKYMSDDTQQRASGAVQTLDQTAISLMPEGKLHNYLYRGTPSLQFEDKSLTWGFAAPTVSNGAAYADLDNDGDLDLITNNINDPAGIYQNQANQLFPNRHFLKIKLQGNTPNRFGVGAKVILKTKETLQVQQLMPTRGFESSVEPMLTFGLDSLARIDSLIVIWPDQHMQIQFQAEANQTLTLRQSDAMLSAIGYQYTQPTTPALLTDISGVEAIPYIHKENNDYFDFVRESLMPFEVSTEGPKLAVGDVNGDGLADFYAGGARAQAGSLLIQDLAGTFALSQQPAFRADSVYEDVDATFFDADGDKDLDLYVVSGGNEFYRKMPELADRLYLNDGKGHFSRSVAALPPMFDNKSCVRPADIDHDGDLDVFVGGRVVGFQYGKIPNSYLLINDGKGHFTDETDQLAPNLRKAGMVTDALWLDLDKDKQLDLVIAGDWMPIRVFMNQNGSFDADKPLADSPLSGFWQCLTAADFDQDGDVDLVAGNLGTNTKFRKDGFGSELKMWVKDVDNNQSIEQIIAYKYKDDWFPANFKDELGKQIPGVINKRFTDYVSFAGKPISKIFLNEELSGADELRVDQFASVYLENQAGTFVVHELPLLAQVSKLFTLQTADIDGDGDLDVLGGGNFYGVSTYQGRYDASYGLVLRNDGKNQFTSLSPVDCGFLLNGEIRDIKPIQTTHGIRYLVARNGGTLQVFQPLRSLKPVARH